MKYQRWHDSIIERAKNRELDDYCERHHIQPRSLGGGNEKSNIVKLTYREHFLVHWLLVKMTEGMARRKMQYALSKLMSLHPRGHRFASSWQYEVARRANHDASKGRKGTPSKIKGLKCPEHGAKLKGRKRPDVSLRFKGSKRSVETCAKISAGKKDKKRPDVSARNKERVLESRSLESRAKTSKSLKGRKKGEQTPEHKAKRLAAYRLAISKRNSETGVNL